MEISAKGFCSGSRTEGALFSTLFESSFVNNQANKEGGEGGCLKMKFLGIQDDSLSVSVQGTIERVGTREKCTNVTVECGVWTGCGNRINECEASIRFELTVCARCMRVCVRVLLERSRR